MTNFNPSTPERLVYWYLRINGFLQLENFVIHPDTGTQQRTDADILAVRFKHRQELQMNPMHDDSLVSDCPTLCNVIIGEVKRGQCSLNGPWTRQEDENIQRVLRALGCFRGSELNMVASCLYREGHFVTPDVTCRLFTFGDSEGQLPIPSVAQVRFDQMIQFIFERFKLYRPQKSSVGNWPKDGQKLRQFASVSADFNDFKAKVRPYFNLRPSS